MLWGDITQTLGIIIMVLGGILASEGIRKLIETSKERALLDYAKLGLMSMFFEILDDSLPRIIADGEDPERKEKYKEWLRDLHSAPSILLYIFLSTLMIAYGLKHSILKYFEHKTSRIGIGLMIIGGIMQIIPIWI